MGLLQRALETYDAMEHLAGVVQEGKNILAPVGHITTKASIQVTVDAQGKFVSAQKTDEKILVAVTEESSGRTSAPSAHCLCEQFGYICPDNSEKFALYVKQLEDWTASAFAHPKVEAILRYVQGGTIKADLNRAGLLKINDAGKVENEKDFIAWSVIGLGESDGPAWADLAVQKCYTAYYLSQIEQREKGLCMVTGQTAAPAAQHLKGVVSLNGNAKIISANDKANFTYRGRFLDDGEALTVGYIASQKAHNALKWLMESQGVLQGGRAFLCWNPKGKTVPDPLAALFHAEEKPADLENYRQKLYDTLVRCKQAITPEDAVIFAAFDAATTGRLSIAYYSEFSAKDFLERLAHWDETCVWYDGFNGVESPSLRRIASFAFGTYREGKGMDLDDKILRQQVQRLLFCRIEGKIFPTDVMRAIVQNAGNLQIYTKSIRQQMLAIACAVIKKYRYDRFKEEWSLALECDKKDRSYQYGRLLAVLDKVEGDVLYKRGEERDTNAIRMQSVFVHRPAYATQIIMDQLKTAYYPRLSPGAKIYYEQLIGEIMEKISECGEEINAPLTETYLFGFYLQRNAFYQKKEKTNVTEEQENA